jgi:hypothetical protein
MSFLRRHPVFCTLVLALALLLATRTAYVVERAALQLRYGLWVIVILAGVLWLLGAMRRTG